MEFFKKFLEKGLLKQFFNKGFLIKKVYAIIFKHFSVFTRVRGKKTANLHEFCRDMIWYLGSLSSTKPLESYSYIFHVRLCGRVGEMGFVV